MPEGLNARWFAMFKELKVSATIRHLVCNAMGELEEYHLPTADHCKRVALLAVEIGRDRDLPLKPLFYGGSLHDRGKMNVARELLDKTTCWTQDDAIALQAHPMDGHDVTTQEGMVVTADLIVRHHTFQANPYPGLVPDRAPFMDDESFYRLARIVALADFYDAAHRVNSGGALSGEEIKVKVLQHNEDIAFVVEECYEAGIFTVHGS